MAGDTHTWQIKESPRHNLPVMMRTSEFRPEDAMLYLRHKFGFTRELDGPVHLRAERRGTDIYEIMVTLPSQGTPGAAEVMALQPDERGLNKRVLLAEAVAILDAYQDFGAAYSQNLSVDGPDDNTALFRERADTSPAHIKVVKAELIEDGMIEEGPDKPEFPSAEQIRRLRFPKRNFIP